VWSVKLRVLKRYDEALDCFDKAVEIDAQDDYAWYSKGLTLQNMLERAGFPQMLLRMGYGPEIPPTPRRSVSEVLSVTWL